MLEENGQFTMQQVFQVKACTVENLGEIQNRCLHLYIYKIGAKKVRPCQTTATILKLEG